METLAYGEPGPPLLPPQRSLVATVCAMLRSRFEVRSPSGHSIGEAWAVLLYRGLAVLAGLLWWYLS
jgi:hypothetical protein